MDFVGKAGSAVADKGPVVRICLRFLCPRDPKGLLHQTVEAIHQAEADHHEKRAYPTRLDRGQRLLLLARWCVDAGVSIRLYIPPTHVKRKYPGTWSFIKKKEIAILYNIQ